MSFKREGNDSGLLNNFRKYRIDELLTLHIPDDEAILLANGRYSCSVCSHRPIFDTISVLAIHRKGKKHLNSLSNRLKIQSEKRLQSEPVTQPVTSVYKTCSKTLKRAKPSPYCRKQTVVVKEKVVDPHAVVGTDKVTAKSIINNYVSTIQRKRDFTAFVEKARNTRNAVLPSTSTNYPMISSKSDKKKIKPQLDIEKRTDAQSYLSLREKGWIKTADGNWVVEEGVEMDSDEEQPIS